MLVILDITNIIVNPIFKYENISYLIIILH